MKKIIITTVIILSAAIVATSSIKISKQKEVKTPVTTITTSNSIHNGNEIASAD